MTRRFLMWRLNRRRRAGVEKTADLLKSLQKEVPGPSEAFKGRLHDAMSQELSANRVPVRDWRPVRQWQVATVALVLILVVISSLLSGQVWKARREIARLNEEISNAYVSLDTRTRETEALEQILDNEVYVPQKMERLYYKAVTHKEFGDYEKAREVLREIIATCPYKEIAGEAKRELRSIAERIDRS